MHVQLRQVTVDEKEILRNLVEKYNFELSQWDKRDVNALGLYGYDYLDHYWTEENRFAYFIMADDKLAGFAMVKSNYTLPEPVDYGIAEFCVLPKYRRAGVGKKAVFDILDRLHGKWYLKMHPANVGGVRFWNSAIAAYTNGHYRLEKNVPWAVFDDGSCADVIFFEN